MITIEQPTPSSRTTRGDAPRRERADVGPTFDEALAEAADRDARHDLARSGERGRSTEHAGGLRDRTDADAGADDRATGASTPPPDGLQTDLAEGTPIPVDAEAPSASEDSIVGAVAAHAAASQWPAPTSGTSANTAAAVTADSGIPGAVASDATPDIRAVGDAADGDGDASPAHGPRGADLAGDAIVGPMAVRAAGSDAGTGSTTSGSESSVPGAGLEIEVPAEHTVTSDDVAIPDDAGAANDADASATQPAESAAPRSASESGDGSAADVAFDATPEHAEPTSTDEPAPNPTTRPASREATLGGATAMRELFDRLELQRASLDGSLEVEIRTERFGLVRVEAADSGDGISLSLRGDGSNGEELHDLARELRQEFERDGRTLADVDVDDRADGADDSDDAPDRDGAAMALASPRGVDLHL